MLCSLVNELSHLGVEGIPLLHPFFGLCVELVPETTVPFSVDVGYTTLLFKLLQEFGHKSTLNPVQPIYKRRAANVWT